MMYKLAESQDLTQGFVCHLIRPSNFTVPVGLFLRQWAKRPVASEAKFIKDMSREISVKEGITPSLLFTGRYREPIKPYTDDKNEKKKDKLLYIIISSSLLAQRTAQADI